MSALTRRSLFALPIALPAMAAVASAAKPSLIGEMVAVEGISGTALVGGDFSPGAMIRIVVGSSDVSEKLAEMKAQICAFKPNPAPPWLTEWVGG